MPKIRMTKVDNPSPAPAEIPHIWVSVWKSKETESFYVIVSPYLKQEELYFCSDYMTKVKTMRVFFKYQEALKQAWPGNFSGFRTLLKYVRNKVELEQS